MLHGGTAVAAWGVNDTVEGLSGEFDLPMIAYTPYAIFSNTIPVFDINFFDPMDDITIEDGTFETETITYESSAGILQSTVSKWYVALRNIALVGLMIVLLYIGIRILIGSVSDKAKYKEMLKDWLVAMCLIFFIHYIMVFVITMCESVGTMFASECTETILVPLASDTKVDGKVLEPDEETGYPIWACSFTGYSRLIAGGFSDYDTMTSIEFTLIYVVLVIYTVIFTIMYLKRVLYMAFLTMIAPLVALTYPIDKINDGKAQGFDTWLKEYIFNALLQPFHMMIYTLVVGTVMQLALDYPIYALVALGFLIPAEKMLRKMFGFEKAQTPSNMGALGLAGTSMLMGGISKLSHRSRRNRDDDETRDKRKNLRMKEEEFDTMENYANENAGTTSTRTSSNTETSDSNSNESPSTPLESPQNTQTSESAFGGDASMEEFLAWQQAAQQGTYDSGNNSSNDSSSASSSEDGSEVIPYRSTHHTYRGMVNTDRGTVITSGGTGDKRSIKNRLANAFMSVGTRYSRKFAKSHPIRSLRRAATWGLGAASLGMAGLAVGIASGDLGKTAQYATTSGLVGGSLGRAIGDSLSSETRNNTEAFRQGWYGSEYQDKLRERMIQESQTDPDNVQYLRERTSNYRQILKEAYPEYARYGCSNIEDFWAAYQMEQAGDSRESAISTYKLAQRTGDISKSPDAESKWAKKLDEEFGNTEVVRAQQQAQQEEIAKQYEAEQKRLAAEYEKAQKEIENSRRKNKEQEFKKLQEESAKKYAELKKKHEERQSQIRMMPSQLTRSALNSVKQFYKNK